MVFWLLAAALLARAHAAEWYDVLKSRVDDDTFQYDSDIWETGAVLNEFDTSDEVNVLTSAYSDVYLESVTITLNKEEYTFEFPEEDKYMYTLKDLVTTDGGYQFDSSYGWLQSTGNYFDYDSAERTAYTKYCSEFGFNYMAYDKWVGRYYYYTPRVRIGVVMDDTTPCYYPTTAEGIGMDANYGAYSLSSGRLQWSGPWTFSAATVSVYGRTNNPVEDQIFFTSWWNYPYDYQMNNLRYKVFSSEEQTPPYTISFHVLNRRTVRWWGNIFQVAEETWERSPALWFYPNYNEDGYYNQYPNWEHSYYWYTGRRFHCSFKSTASNYDSVNAHASVALGKWTHYAIVAHWEHLVIYINGEVQYVKEIYGTLNPVEKAVPYMSISNWHAECTLYGMRYYNGRVLRTPYLRELAASWPPISCSDGERAYGEQCDDGNKLDGDGCSSSCELEPGFVCRGQDVWGVSVDRCEEGTQHQFYAFDDEATGLDDWILDGSAATYEVLTNQDPARAWAGDGALHIENRKATTGVAYSYAEFDVDGDVNERSFLEFAMFFERVPTAYHALIVTVYDKASNGGETLDPSDCQSSPYCDDVVFYRMCYNRRTWTYCDEVRPEVAARFWTVDTLEFAENFYEKYEFLPSELPTAGLTVQFALRTESSNDDSWGEVWIDNVAVQSPAETYPYQGLTVESYAYGGSPHVSIEVGGVEQISGNGDDGFNVVVVDGTSHDVLEGPLSFAEPEDMAGYVLGLKPGVVVLMAAKTPNTCQDSCADAMDYIGGHQYTGATGSMAIIGVTAGNKNAVPFRVGADGDAAARVHSMVRFHHVNDTVAELFYENGKLGFPVRADDEEIVDTTTYGISAYQTGYLGCYRVGSSREFSHTCYSSWGYNSPAHCAVCCGKKGYTYFSLWYYYRCYCGDTYGNRDCDFSGDCGLPRVHDKWCTDRRTYGDLQQTSGSYYYEAVYMVTGRGERIYDYPLTSSITCTDGRSTDRCNYIYDESTGNDYRSNDYTSLTDNYADIEMLFAEARELSHVRIWWYDDYTGHATEWSLSYTTDGTTWVEHHVNTNGHFQGRYWDVVYLPEHLEFLGVKLALLAPGDGSYYRINEVYFFEPSSNHWGQNLPMDLDYIDDDAMWDFYYMGIQLGTGHHFKGNEAFKCDSATGQASLKWAVMNYEYGQGLMVGIVAYENGYDSDWFTMTANQGIDSFVQLEHGLSTRPDWVQVQAKATDGNNNGYAFQGVGSVQGTGALAESYGGLLFAYSETSVRLWAPTSSNASVTGYIINVQNGWGGEENAQGSESASVRVTAFVAPAPDYDSGWFEMESQNEADAVKVFKHTIGDLLHARVKLMYRPLDGDNAGYSFEAAGCQQTDDDYGTYGGLLFNYDSTEIRVFAPMRNDIAGDNCPDGYRINLHTQLCTVVDPDTDGFGHIVNIPDGWAHESAYQQVSDQAEVRVQIWVLGSILHMPYGTAEFSMSANGLAYAEHAHKFSALPIYVKAVVIGEEDDSLGFHYEGMGSAQTTDYRPKKNYGGIVFGYSDYYIRAWAPGQSSSSIKHAYGSLVLCSDGYGNGTYAVAQQAGVVRILAYKEYYGMTEYAYIKVDVLDVNEKPNAALIAADLLESTEAGLSLGTIDAIDEDFVSNITIEVLESEYSSVFDIDSDYNVVLVDNSLLDYEKTKYFDLQLRVHDDDIVVDTLISVTVIDGNDPCELWPPFEFTVPEASPKNTLVGDPINATDADWGQEVIFSLDEDEETFRIASCGGQLFVLDGDNLDHESITGYNDFNITVWAVDDGVDAINTSAVVRIRTTNVNDEPIWITPIYLEVEENSAPDTVLNGSLFDYAYDVDAGDYLNFTIAAVANQVLTDTEDGGGDASGSGAEGETEEELSLMYMHADGSLVVGSITLNYEEADSMAVDMLVTDGNPNGQPGTPNLQATAKVTVYITDANDPPEFTDDLQRYIYENSPAGTALDAPVIANDEDVFDYIDYEFIEDAGGMFEFDVATGVVSLVNGSTIDYETNQTFTLIVQARDHGILTNNVTVGEDKINIINGYLTVTVYDVNEAPVVEDMTTTVPENSEYQVAVGDPVVVSDPDVLAFAGKGQAISFAIVGGNTDDEIFYIDDAGQLYVNNPIIDYESGVIQYVLTVEATDDGSPPMSATATVTIDVEDLNDAPYFVCPFDIDVDGFCDELFVNENSKTGTFVGTVSAEDPENGTLIYSIYESEGYLTVRDGTNELEVAFGAQEFLDSETFYLDDANSIVVMNVEDIPPEGKTAMSAQMEFKLTLNDVDEPPDVQDCTVYVSGDASDGDPAGKSLEIVANPYYPDRDMDPDDYSVLSFSIFRDENDPLGVFIIEPATGQLYVDNQTPLNTWNPVTDGNLIFYYGILVTDGPNFANFTVAVNVSNDNQAPYIDDNFVLTVEENTAAGTPCDPTFSGSDDDVFDKLSYTLSGSSAEFAVETLFADDEDQGYALVSVLADNVLDYEVQNQYEFDVIVEDNAGTLALTTATHVTINVLDVNDAPTAQDVAYSLYENPEMGFRFGLANCNDQDGDDLSFAILAGNDDGKFSLAKFNESAFEVVVEGELDYETLNAYALTVEATDPEAASVQLQVAISVLDVNEPPVLVGLAMNVDENSQQGTDVVLDVFETEGDYLVDIVDPDRDHDDGTTRDQLAVSILSGDEDGAFKVFLARDDGHQFFISVASDTALDFEDVETYELEILVQETDTPNPRWNTTAWFNVSVNNLNDVTIEQYADGDAMLVPESPLDVIDGTGLLPTVGGARVNITGTNFGNMHTPEPVEATYGATGVEYTAVCEVVPGGNTMISCLTPEGVGRNHIWHVVTNPDTWAHDTRSDAIAGFEEFYTGYQAPAVTGVALVTSAGGKMRTEGGDTLVITGTNFGPAADTNLQFLGVGELDSSRTRLAQATTADNREECVAARSFLELALGDSLALNINGAAVDEAYVTVTSRLHPSLTGLELTPSELRRVPCVSASGEGYFEVVLQVSPDDSSDAAIVAATPLSVYGSVGPALLLSNMPHGLTDADATPADDDVLYGVELRAEDCVITEDHVTMECTTPAGVGAEFEVEVLAGAQLSAAYSSEAEELTYHRPIVTEILERDVLMDTSGGDPVTLLGAFFGDAGAFAGYGHGLVGYYSSYGTYFAECSVWGSASVQIDVVADDGSTASVQRDVLNCTSAPGVSYDLPWNVTVGEQMSAPSAHLTAYKPPEITEMPEGYWPFPETQGGNTVVLRGDEFGFEDEDIDYIRYGVPNQFAAGSWFEITSPGCDITSSEAQEEFTCLTVPGTGAHHVWLVSVGGQESNVFEANSSYAAPIVTDFQVPNLADGESMTLALELYSTRGYESLRILGRNFGPALDDEAYTSSYVAPLKAFATWNEFTFPAVDCFVSESHVEIECNTTQGVGSLLKWFVYVDYQESYVASTSYGPPIVEKVRDEDYNAMHDAATVGGEIVKLIGENFGPCYVCEEDGAQNFLEDVSYGADGDEYDVTSDCWVSIPHTEISCYTAAGVGRNLRWYVTVGSQRMSDYDSINGPTMSYAVPNITDVSPDYGSTTGGYEVTVSGTNFGPLKATKLQFWGLTMKIVDYGDDHDYAIFEMPAGQHVMHELLVTQVSKLESHSQVSDPAYFNYTLPVIDRLITQEGSTRESKLLTLHGVELDTLLDNGGKYSSGESFVWTKDDGTRVTYSNQVTSFAFGTEVATAVKCESTGLLWSHDEITCEVARVNGTLVVDVSGRWSNVVEFDNPSPIITDLIIDEVEASEATFPTAGGSAVTIHGRYFEEDATNLAVKLMSQYYDEVSGTRFMPDVLCGNLTVEVTDVELSEGTITCILPPGQGANIVVKVVRGSAQSSDWTLESDTEACFPCFSYAVPDIAVYADGAAGLAFPISTPTEGLGNVTLQGDNLGESFARVFIEGFEMPVVAQDHDQITFTLPAGVGTEHGLVVMVGGQETTAAAAATATEDEQVTYLAPTLATITADTVDGLLPTVGEVEITIAGDNFGELAVPDLADEAGWLGRRCPAPEYVDDDTVVAVDEVVTGPWTYNTSLATFADGDAFIASCDAGTVESVDVVYGGDYAPAAALEPFSTTTTTTVECEVDWVNATTAYFAKTTTVSTFDTTIELFDCVPTNVSLAHAFGKDEAGFVLFSLYPDTKMDIVSWTHDEIVVVAPEGEATGHSFTVSVGGQSVASAASDATQILDYRAPVITAEASPNQGHTNGRDEADAHGVYITLTGTDFGSQGQTASFDGEEQLPTYADHTTLVFKLPRGQGEDIAITMTVGAQTSNTVEFDYFGPQLHWMTPVNGPTSGCEELETMEDWIVRTDGVDPYLDEARRGCAQRTVVTIYGRSMGHSAMAVMLGPNAGIPMVQNHTVATFEVPSWYGTNHNVTLEVEGRVSNGLRYDYDPPYLTSSNPGSIGRLFLYEYADATGDSLHIEGGNLGAVETDVNITIGGEECLDAQWHSGIPDSREDLPYLSCEMQGGPNGAKNVTVDVAEQSVDFLVPLTLSEAMVVTICKTKVQSDLTTIKYYGAYGEVCLPCPEGAVCSAYEGYDDPWAEIGFWREYYDSASSTAADYCEPDRMTRDECPAFLPCEPEEACAGNNTCAEGYEYMIYECADYQASRGVQTCESDLDCDPNPTKECSYKRPYQCTECVFDVDDIDATEGVCTCIASIRCSLCTVREYFKLDGKCEPCPSNPWVLIIGFACGAVFACIAGYVLNRKKFNLAFLSIGVDYFQILALFSSADVAWPTLVLDIFRWLSIFNFNIDITAPECAMPDLQYEDKWQGIMVLPIVTGIMTVTAYLFLFIKHRVCKGQGELDPDTLIASYLVLFYYLYLTLTKKALDIFHCVPVEPDDGYTYASFTSVNCETGLCRCWEPDSVQMTLFPWAVICFLAYSLGFPLMVGTIIFTNKTLIKEDQLLRAKGLEHAKQAQTKGSRADKASHIRARYHKLYYHFKPGKVYWILVIINRKFWIALSGLMFADNPAFQFSVILLVLFMSYVVQIKHRPFMSTVERAAVIKEHERKAETSRKHMRIANAISQEEEKKQGRQRTRKAGLEGQRTRKKEAVQSYFWDYNTVEAYLLACAILISLAAIMFDASADTEREDIEAHRVFITYMTLIVIFFSLGYYFLVLFSEIGSTFGVNEWRITQKLMSKNAHAEEEDVIDEAEIETAANPMLARNTAQLMAAQQHHAEAEIELANMNETNRELLSQLAAAKQREQEMAAMGSFMNRPAGAGAGGGAAGARKKKGARRQSKVTKREFAPQQSA